MTTFDLVEWQKAERALIVSALNYADHPDHSHARGELLGAARHYRILATLANALTPCQEIDRSGCPLKQYSACCETAGKPPHRHRASCHGAIGELQCGDEN
jgi:hypothetical protein